MRRRTLLFFGFLLWLIPFVVAFIIFPLRETNRALFESIMPVVLALCGVTFAGLYLSRMEAAHLRAGVLAGSIWFSMSIVIDLLLFMWGPMRMSFLAYVADIGVTYLIYPVVTTGMGWLLEAQRERSPYRPATRDLEAA